MTSSKLISTLATFGAAGAIAWLLVTKNLIAHDPFMIAVQVGAFLLMLWARLIFGMRSFHFAANPTQGELVTRGPYALMRHPIYSAVILFLWAGIADHFALVTVLIALLATAALLTRVILEERLLRERYPEYEEYARRVKRLIPFIY
jgi:protein-S-isoprenylcysteine O-methyltransferase Ste14